MQEKAKSESMLKPIVVLTAICLVVSLALALTNGATKPIIDAANAQRALETRMEMLPDATSFTECDLELKGVESVYKDDGGSGYVVTTVGKGYRGDVTVVVGLDASGTIIGVKADASGETPDVGSRAGEAAHTGQFVGLTPGADTRSVDAVAGATISSHAVADAVSLALEAYAAVKEGSFDA